jgi:TonB family protein
LSRIPTGDVLDGIKYYIKIVPIDTTLDEHMPMYKPHPDDFVLVDAQPLPIKEVPPKYPAEARNAKIEGTVWIKCLVGKDGKVTKPIVMKSDASVFDKAAIAAVLQWTFSPAWLKGKPIAVWVAIPFRFKLNKR